MERSQPQRSTPRAQAKVRRFQLLHDAALRCPFLALFPSLPPPRRRRAPPLSTSQPCWVYGVTVVEGHFYFIRIISCWLSCLASPPRPESCLASSRLYIFVPRLIRFHLSRFLAATRLRLLCRQAQALYNSKSSPAIAFFLVLPVAIHRPRRPLRAGYNCPPS